MHIKPLEELFAYNLQPCLLCHVLGPIVVVQEGGYYLKAVADCAAGVLQGIVRARGGADE